LKRSFVGITLPSCAIRWVVRDATTKKVLKSLKVSQDATIVIEAPSQSGKKGKGKEEGRGERVQEPQGDNDDNKENGDCDEDGGNDDEGGDEDCEDDKDEENDGEDNEEDDDGDADGGDDDGEDCEDGGDENDGGDDVDKRCAISEEKGGGMVPTTIRFVNKSKQAVKVLWEHDDTMTEDCVFEMLTGEFCM
jgi:hypothetical protein